MMMQNTLISKFNNIFLDFFSRDSQEIYGLNANTTPKKLRSFLTEALTVAIFLCDDFCIMPPSFLVESKATRDVLLLRSEYLSERLVRLPLREQSLEEFWNKKQREYALFKDQYPDVFDKQKQNFIRKYSEALLPRTFQVSSEIIATWEAGPDNNPIWRSIISQIEPQYIESLRHLPRSIKERGMAITWSAINTYIGSNTGFNSKDIHNLLQHHYLSTYIKNFNLRVISSLPFELVDFFLLDKDLCYDYEALKKALSSLGLWNVIRLLSAPSLTSLRTKAGYFSFRDTFNDVTILAKNTQQVSRIFAIAAAQLNIKSDELNFANELLPDRGWLLTESQIDLLAYILGEAARLANEVLKEQIMSTTNSQNQSFQEDKINKNINDKKYVIAIFVALDFERKILIERWGLKGSYEEELYRGKLNNTEVVIFSPAQMGRVAAAVATMRFLNKSNLPDMLIVTGIAGGFEREETRLGDVIVAESIADLATRKIRETENNLNQEFRPIQFAVDNRLIKFLKSGSFDISDWERRAIKEADWPDGLRPTIKFGTLASLDEVVSSKEWIEKLCKAWPKLMGIEMEAGGVCAAAESYGMKVAVIRGVSDQADPSKSDNEWRKRAMKTVVHLLEQIDFQTVLSKEN
jgi:nucleoside phosphorylase